MKEKTGIAGIGIAGKDFDNTMHMFLDFMYSNGGTVLDTTTARSSSMTSQRGKPCSFTPTSCR